MMTLLIFLAVFAHRGINGLSVGRVVEFVATKGKPVSLGACVGTEGNNKWKVVDSEGRTAVIPKTAIKHVVYGSDAKSADDVRRYTEKAEQVVAAFSSADDTTIDDVWELVSEEEEQAPVGLAGLSELILGESGCEALYATYVLLGCSVAGRARFKLSRAGGFSPRSAGEATRLLAQLRAEADAKAAAEREASTTVARIQAAMVASSSEGGLDVAAESDATRRKLGAVERLGCRAGLPPAVDVAEATDDEARAFLHELGCKATAESARAVLGRLGVWDAHHENLDLIRSRTPTFFSDALESDALRIVDTPPDDVDASRRLDLTHLAAYAIDAASTNEVDDAVSVEIIDDGTWRIWVHVADVTRYLGLETKIAEEARRRSSSLYLPTGTIPMLPLSLATGPLSLAAQETSCALSFGILVDAASGEILQDGDHDGAPISMMIAPSLVSATRLTYAKVDDLLLTGSDYSDDDDDDDDDDDEDDAGKLSSMLETLRRLNWIAKKRLALRAAQGSVEHYDRDGLPDLEVKAIKDDAEIDGWRVTVDSRAGGSSARGIVTELMVLAGEAVARYGAHHAIPMPFRAQRMERPDDDELEITPEGPCTAWLVITGLRGGSAFSSTPQPHEGLGLAAYVQVTSPIRRYADFALHAQLKAHLRGDPLPYPDPEALCSLASATFQNMPNLERSAKEYWLKVFLKRNTQPLRAIVLARARRSENDFKLLLPDLGAIVDVNANGPTTLTLGAQLEVSTTTAGDVVVSKILT